DVAKALHLGDFTFPLGGRHDGARFGAGDGLWPGGLREERVQGRPWQQGHPAGREPTARLALHDEEHIDAAVLFPGPTLNTGTKTSDPEVARIACEAYNRWAADFVASAPRELYFVACLPKQSGQHAAAELRRCVTEHDAVGGVIKSAPGPHGLPLGDPDLAI